MERFRYTNEQYPYMRGLVCDFGYRRAEDPTSSRRASKGRTKHSLYTLYDVAMLGITNHSKVPLRIATISGFALSRLQSAGRVASIWSRKLLFWNELRWEWRRLLIGIYFFGAEQLFFIGILGEYIGSIHTQVHRRPLVVERERINLEGRPELPESVLSSRELPPMP